MLVEVCCNSLASALNAEKGGADRIELCSELGVGGITPSYGLIQLVKEKLTIPIHVLIRPRSGHFTYSDLEFKVLLKDIEWCKKIAVDGIVSGVLMSDGKIDFTRTKKLVDFAKPLHVTFHRAFDWIPDFKEAVLKLEDLGVDAILTSGKQTSADLGIKVLEQLNTIVTSLVVMPGGGINIRNCINFKASGFKAIHLSGTSFKNEISLKEKLPMNSKKHFTENKVAITNEDTIRKIVKTVK